MHAQKGAWKTYAGYILFTQAVGALAGWLTRAGVEAYKSIDKSALTPPDIVFPIVWGILYLLMAVGAAQVALSAPSRARTEGLLLFFFQLALNFSWSLVHFNLQAFGAALWILVALWVLIILMTVCFHRAKPCAGWLQVPYILWVTFAAYLNYATWRLNH